MRCKVIQDREQLPRSSSEWTRASKCTLQMREDRLTFLDKSIPYSLIDKAELHIYQSALFFEYGIFSIHHEGTTTHFGIKYDDYWKGDLPVEVERKTEETPFLLVRKSVIVVMIIYIIWEILTK